MLSYILVSKDETNFLPLLCKQSVVCYLEVSCLRTSDVICPYALILMGSKTVQKKFASFLVMDPAMVTGLLHCYCYIVIVIVTLLHCYVVIVVIHCYIVTGLILLVMKGLCGYCFYIFVSPQNMPLPPLI